MKTLDDYGEGYRKCWAIYEAFRRLGFADRNIEVIHGEDGSLVLRLFASDIEFIAVAGMVPEDHETVRKTWDEIGEVIIDKNVPQDSFSKCWKEFMPLDVILSLASAIIEKGIALPKFSN
jgi:hypothetical protein